MSQFEDKSAPQNSDATDNEQAKKPSRRSPALDFTALEPMVLMSASPGDFTEIDGTEDADVLFGTSGKDLVKGLEGADNIFGDDGDDRIFGGAGADSILGGKGNDEIHGEAGDDYIAGGEGDDAIYAGEGADTIELGGGHDTVDGGDGIDKIDLYKANGGVTVDLTDGTVAGGGISADLSFVEAVIGSQHDDTYTFNSPAEGDTFFIYGGDGSNRIDLSQFSSEDLTVSEGSISGSAGEGEFKIFFAGVDELVFADGVQSYEGQHSRWPDEYRGVLGGIGEELGLFAVQDNNEGPLISVGPPSEPPGEGGPTTPPTPPPADNNNPVALDDEFTFDEDTILQGNVLQNDTDADGDEVELFRVITAPANGLLTIDAQGNFTYQPNEHYYGLDTFTYEITDRNGGTETALVRLNVLPVNDAPEATPQHRVIAEDTVLTGNVVQHVTDVEDDPIDVTRITQQPSLGTLEFDSNGDFRYTPDPDANGDDTFTFEVSDGNGGFTEVLYTVQVTPVADAPRAADDSFQLMEDTTARGNVLVNDVEVDGETFSVSQVLEQPENGHVTINANGDFIYTPKSNYNGPDRFVYEIVDETGLKDTAEVVFNVIPVNDGPNALNDQYDMTENEPLVANVLDNDSDVENDILAIQELLTQPSNGRVDIDEDGRFTYTPDTDFVGTDTFQYIVNDGNGGSAIGTVTIDVEAVEPVFVNNGSGEDVPAPVALTMYIEAGEESTVGLTIPNRYEADDVEYRITGLPAGATLTNGLDLGNGAWRVRGDELEGLRLETTTAVEGEFQLVVESSYRNESVQLTDDLDTAESQWTIEEGIKDGSFEGDGVLGPFTGTDGEQGVYRTFEVPDGVESVVIEFDFLENDSWDGEDFLVFANDQLISSDPYYNAQHSGGSAHYGNDGDRQFTRAITEDFFIGNKAWSDQIHRYRIVADVVDGEVKIGFGSTLNQGLGDESWAINNLVISENAKQFDTIDLTVQPAQPADVNEVDVLGQLTDGDVKVSLDTNPAENQRITRVTVTGLPQDLSLNKGTVNSDGSISLSPNDLNDIFISGNADNDFALRVRTDYSELKTVYFEDFEDDAAGWNANTTQSSSQLGSFLGRFNELHDGAAAEDAIIEKTFAMPTNVDEVILEFDQIQIEEWEGEAFTLYINGEAIQAEDLFNKLRLNEHGEVELERVASADSDQDLGFGANADSKTHYVVKIKTGGRPITVGFGSNLDQNVSDEAWGVDNVRISYLEKTNQLDSVLVESGVEQEGPKSLIENGSFELFTNAKETSWGNATQSVAGWALESGTRFEPHKPRAGVQATDGDVWMDMGLSPGNLTISQQVDGVEDGKNYEITFDVANTVDTTNGLDVYWNGEKVATIEDQDKTWDKFSINVQGGSGDGSNTLRFEGTGNEDNFGISLDNVEMFEVADVIDAPTEVEMTADKPLALELGLVDGLDQDKTSVTIVGLPEGAILSPGVLNQDGSWTITAAESQSLTLRTPTTFAGEIDLSVTVDAVPTESPDVVFHSSFENNDIENRGWGVFDEVEGWKTLSGEGIEVQENVAGSASHGDSKVELDSHNFDDEDLGTNSGMYQDVPTVVGQSYVLSFDYSPRPGVSADSTGVEVYWNGELLGTMSESGEGLSDTEWNTHSFKVDSDASTGRIEFRAVGDADSYGGYIDNVSLAAATTNTAQMQVAVAEAEDPDNLVSDEGFSTSIEPHENAPSIENLSGDVELREFGTDGIDFSRGHTEAHDAILFREPGVTVLEEPLTVNLVVEGDGVVSANNETLPAGTAVESFFLHLDTFEGYQPVEGSITFDRPIHSLIFTTGALNDSDHLGRDVDNFMHESGDNGRARYWGEGGDKLTIADDGYTLQFEGIVNQTYLDNVRILFVADADAGETPDNFVMSQDILGLESGKVYDLTIDIDDPDGSGETVEVFFGGEKVAEVDPARVQDGTFKVDVRAGSGDGSDELVLKSPSHQDGLGIDVQDVAMKATDNLLVNASFENISGLTEAGWGHYGDQIQGWQLEDDSGAGDRFESHNPRGGVEATDGDFWMDMGGSPGNLKMSQQVPGVVDGESYKLSFDLADSAHDSTDGLRVIWNGEVIAEIDQQDNTMDRFEFEVQGGSGDGSNTITFEGTGNSDNFGVSLDNIELVNGKLDLIEFASERNHISIDASNLDANDGFRIFAQRVDGDGNVVEPAELIVQSDGKIGVAGTPEAGVANQIGLNAGNNVAEQVVIEFDNQEVTGGEFTFTNLFKGEGDSRGGEGHEQAKWEAFSNGEVVASGVFVAENSNAGTVSIELPEGVTADKIAVTPTEYSGGQNGVTSDSSDFFLTSIEVDTVSGQGVGIAAGTSGHAIDLGINLGDQVGSGSIVNIEGLPEGSILSAGSQNADGSWSVMESDVAGLQLRTPNNVFGEVEVSITVNAVSEHAANMIVNGSFEENELSGGWSVYDEVPGWTASQGSGIEIQEGVAGSAADGDAKVELDSHNNSGMYQDIPTQDGQTYSLSFQYSPRPGVATASNTVEVYWNGELLGSMSESGVGLSDTEFRTYTFEVEGNGEEGRLEFRAAGREDSYGGYIDDVTLMSTTQDVATLQLTLEDPSDDETLQVDFGLDVPVVDAKYADGIFIHDSQGKLALFNTETHEYTEIGTMGAIMTDVAVSPSGELFGVSFNKLYSIDPETAESTEIGALGGFGMNSLTFTPDGQLYGGAYNSTNLFSIDVNTGQASPAGTMGEQSSGDLVYHEGELMMSTRSGKLISIDMENGRVTGTDVVGSISGGTYGVASTGDDELYAAHGTTIQQLNDDTAAASFVDNVASNGMSTIYGMASYNEVTPDAHATISGVPEGATLSAGTQNPDGSWKVPTSDLSDLKLSLPKGADSDFELTLEHEGETEAFDVAEAAEDASDHNFIVNGSFENTGEVKLSNNGWAPFQGLEGWKLDEGTHMEVVDSGHRGVEATDGENWLDMENSPGNVMISQQVLGLEDGTVYTVTFDTINTGNRPDNALELYWNGEKVLDVGANSGTNEVTVRAGSGDGTNTLTFRSADETPDNVGLALDNIRMVENENLLVNGSFENLTDMVDRGWGWNSKSIQGWTNDSVQQIDFNDGVISHGGYGQDRAGEFEVQEDGDTLSIPGNGWKSVLGDYTITEDTWIELEYRSTETPEIVFIGFDTDATWHNGVNTGSENYFKLFGPQSHGDTAGNAFDVYEDHGQYQKIRIPIGQFTTGDFDRMTFINDDDNLASHGDLDTSVEGNSFFRNVRIYENDGNDFESHRPRGGVEASDGDYWMDMGGSPGNLKMSQEVPGVQDGENYVLSFDVADSIHDTSDGLRVIWNGEVIAEIENQDASMDRFEFQVTGGSGDGSNTLTFEGTGADNNFGVALDNVELVSGNLDLIDDSAVAGTSGKPVNLELDLTDFAKEADSVMKISGLPADAILNSGIQNADGSWTVAASEAESLTMTSSPTTAGEMQLGVQVSTPVDSTGNLVINGSFENAVVAVAVENPGFEADNHADGRWSGGTPGWDQIGSAGDWDPTASHYASLSGAEQVAWANTANASQIAGFGQTLSQEFDSSRNYELTVDIGNRTDGHSLDAKYEIRLMAGDTVIGVTAGTTKDIPDGTFRSVRLNVDGQDLSEYDGQDLRIEILNTGTENNYVGQVNFDNVRLMEMGNTGDAGSERLSQSADGQERGWGVFDQVEGWKTLSGEGIEIQEGVAGSAADGNAKVELDSHNFDSDAEGNNSGMYQDVPTVEGQTYSFEFQYSPRPGVPEASNGIEVYWNGELLDTISGDGVGASNTQWSTHTFNVEGNGETGRIEFRAVGTEDSLGGYIDDVSLRSNVTDTAKVAVSLEPPTREEIVDFEPGYQNTKAEVWGSENNDSTEGTRRSETMKAFEGDDELTGAGGDDIIDGGVGNDTANYSGSISEYEITRLEDGSYQIVDTVEGRDGTDIVKNVEQFGFSDADVTEDQLPIMNRMTDLGGAEDGQLVSFKISGDHYDPNNVQDDGAGSPHYQIVINGETFVDANGNSTFEVEANRNRVVDYKDVDGDGTMDQRQGRDLNDFEFVSLKVPNGIEIETAEIRFVNDAWDGTTDNDKDDVYFEDRNLIVDHVHIGGQLNADGSYEGGTTFEAEDSGHAMRELSNGTFRGADEVMAWTGSVSFYTDGVELLEGGEGEDQVRLAGSVADYEVVELRGGAYKLIDTGPSDSGTKIVRNFDSFAFEDAILSLDDLLALND